MQAICVGSNYLESTVVKSLNGTHLRCLVSSYTGVVVVLPNSAGLQSCQDVQAAVPLPHHGQAGGDQDQLDHGRQQRYYILPVEIILLND